MLALPRNCMGLDVLPVDVVALSERLSQWVHAFAGAHGVRVVELTHDGIQSFETYELDGLGVWLLHNRWASIVGAVAVPPKAGFAFAVDQDFVPVDVPEFLRSWGPTVPSAIDLNAELTDQHWTHITATDRTYADKFKPTKVSHVLFNYWD